jgi:co-chaperonin GroES (HSP10)
MDLEPLHDLIMVRVERQQMLSANIIAASTHAGVQRMRVVACQEWYWNGMGAKCKIRVVAGDVVVPKHGFMAHAQPLHLDEKARKAIYDRNKEAGASDEDAVHDGLLDGEVILLPYSQIALIDRRDVGARIIKPDLPKRNTAEGGFTQ